MMAVRRWMLKSTTARRCRSAHRVGRISSGGWSSLGKRAWRRRYTRNHETANVRLTLECSGVDRTRVFVYLIHLMLHRALLPLPSFSHSSQRK